jgi:CheY-like chemotaxis protein
VIDRDLILLVEDNEANSILATAVLERDGFEVEVANSALEAHARLRQASYDLILMDFQLPGQDGLSLTRQLRAQPATACIPIVALTAHAMAGDRERALDAGCSGYVSKPIDTRTFGNQVQELLKESRRSRGKEGIAS